MSLPLEIIFLLLAVSAAVGLAVRQARARAERGRATCAPCSKSAGRPPRILISVLMDIEMPGGDGLSATRAIKHRPNPPAVVVMSVYADERLRARPGGEGRWLCRKEPIFNGSALSVASRVQWFLNHLRETWLPEGL